MASQPQYLFTQLTRPDASGVTALVAFALVSSEGEVFYLVIRYIDYPSRVEGDHLYLSLEQVLEAVSDEYGISPGAWRPLSAAEIMAIDANIKPSG